MGVRSVRPWSRETQHMKNRRHLLMLSLMGWYLMLPPAARQQNGLPWPDATAPIAHWAIAESFDRASSCEANLSKHRKSFQKLYTKMSGQNLDARFWSRFYISASAQAICIATDDPRLREAGSGTASAIQPSNAD
jgi:hypothetical protein